MKLIKAECPNCGARLSVESNSELLFCSHCGGKLIIDDEKQHVVYDNAEEAGYQFEKGRQKAQEEYYQSHKSETSDNKPRRTKSKGSVWWWIIGWLVIFPIPVTILLVRSKKLNNKTKLIIGSLVWILYLFIGLVGNVSSGDNTTNNATNNIRSLNMAVSHDITLKVGEKDTLNNIRVDVRNRNQFTNSDVIFVSENPNVATISFTEEALTVYLYFEVTAVAPGETYVYAQSADGTVISEKMHVIVPSPILPEALNIEDANRILLLGEKQKLIASVLPDNAEDKTLIFESSDTEVITISDDGQIIGVGDGVATISATTVNGITETCNVTVDGTSRMMTLKITRIRDDDNNIGSDWTFTNKINEETVKNGQFKISVGDELTFFSRYSEDDDNPDIGEKSFVYTVTEEDFINGFEISYDVNVTENGGKNSGKSARFVVSYNFGIE